jgi:hypothetical protein
MPNRSKTAVLAGMLAMASIGMAQTDPTQVNAWELAHPDAKLMIGIDLKSLRESAAGRALSAEWKAQPQQIGPAAVAMGFLQQVDRVFLSSPALGPSKPAPSKIAGKAAATPVNPPFLMTVEGSLPVQQLLAFLPGTSHRYHEIDIFHGAKATDASIAALDAHTILLGDEKSVLAAIDRRSKTLPQPSPLLKRAQELAATHDVWIIADDSLSNFQPRGTDVSNPLASRLASQIKGLDMGLSVRDGLQFDLSLAAESEAAAAQLSQMFSAQLSLALLAQANNPQAAEMAKRLHIDAEGTHVRASFMLTAEEFAQQVKAMQAAMAARAQAAAQPAAAGRQPTPATPRPVTPGKIRIYGLDEGVKEIPLTH